MGIEKFLRDKPDRRAADTDHVRVVLPQCHMPRMPLTHDEDDYMISDRPNSLVASDKHQWSGLTFSGVCSVNFKISISSIPSIYIVLLSG